MSSGDDFVYCGGWCGPQVEWKGHSRLSCDFCNEFGRGGRPSKKKRTSLSESQSTETEVQEEAGNTNVKYFEVNETEVNGIDETVHKCLHRQSCQTRVDTGGYVRPGKRT